MSALKLRRAKLFLRSEGRMYFCDKTSEKRYSLKVRYKAPTRVKKVLEHLANEVRRFKGRNPYGPKMVTRYLFDVR